MLSHQQQTVLDFIARHGSVTRHAPYVLRLRGGPHRTLNALRALNFIVFDDDSLRWSITDAGLRAASKDGASDAHATA